MNCPKIVLFDLDGVILDTESIYMNLMLKYNDIHKIHISKDYYISNLLGKTKKQINDVLVKKNLKNELSKEYWDGLLKYREDYINKNRINVKKGFFNLVDYLKNGNISIGIVTSNSLVLVKKLLIRAQIDINMFDIIITREDVNATKPSPDLYLIALEKLNINSNQVIAIEDSNVGIISAASANIRVINVADLDNITKMNKEKCFAIVQSLDDIINIFEEKRS
jgi:HAD superfamily hydrolase (TIGR01509 family)